MKLVLVSPDCEIKSICTLAVEKFGIPHQLRQAQEECGELIVGVNHYLRKTNSETRLELINEIADVSIMIEQLKLIFGDVSIRMAINMKLSRLKELLGYHKGI